ESEPLSSRSPYLHCAVSRTLNLKLPTFIPDVSDISVISLTLIRAFDNPTGLVWGDKGRDEGAKDRGEYRKAAGASYSLKVIGCFFRPLCFLRSGKRPAFRRCRIPCTTLRARSSRLRLRLIETFGMLAP